MNAPEGMCSSCGGEHTLAPLGDAMVVPFHVNMRLDDCEYGGTCSGSVCPPLPARDVFALEVGV